MTKWKRVGKCEPEKCGSFCCKCANVVVMDEAKFEKSRKYLMNFPCFKAMKVNDKYFLVNLSNCRYLGLDGKCMNYEDRPSDCKDFPANPNTAFFRICKIMGCTYSFEEVKE